jgi:hypothetical protein
MEPAGPSEDRGGGGGVCGGAGGGEGQGGNMKKARGKREEGRGKSSKDPIPAGIKKLLEWVRAAAGDVCLFELIRWEELDKHFSTTCKEPLLGYLRHQILEMRNEHEQQPRKTQKPDVSPFSVPIVRAASELHEVGHRILAVSSALERIGRTGKALEVYSGVVDEIKKLGITCAEQVIVTYDIACRVVYEARWIRKKRKQISARVRRHKRHGSSNGHPLPRLLGRARPNSAARG